jgi:hypothetical protein
VQIHQRYKQRGVVFLGFTTHDRQEADSFLRRTGIDWPNAYRLNLDIAPTIYVCGVDGRVVWTDNQARRRHDVSALAAELEAAIERALAVSAGST